MDEINEMTAILTVSILNLFSMVNNSIPESPFPLDCVGMVCSQGKFEEFSLFLYFWSEWSMHCDQA